MTHHTTVVALYCLTLFLYSRRCSLGVGLRRSCGRGTAFCYMLTERQLGFLNSLGGQFREAGLATVVAGKRLGGACLAVVAGGFLNANSQSLHLKAPGGDVGQSDDLSANVRSKSGKQVSCLLQLANGQKELRPQLVKVCSKAADRLAQRLAGFKVPLFDLNVSHDGGPELFKKEVSEVFFTWCH